MSDNPITDPDYEDLKDRLDSAIKRISALEKFIYTLYDCKGIIN
jgi:hypothetical protein